MAICLNCFNQYDDYLGMCPVCGSGDLQARDENDLVPGSNLSDGRYIIGLSINSGGFGIIYKAWDTKLETIVAIKEFYPKTHVMRSVGSNMILVSDEYREEFEYRKNRFLSEARHMARFGSQTCIPNVFEHFEENNTAYIVMEFLEGQSLRDYMAGNQIDPDFALYITNEVGRALTLLHEAGIIHRDVAPDNIFICSDRNVSIKLLDIGS